jgi:hypothetical protein
MLPKLAVLVLLGGLAWALLDREGDQLVDQPALLDGVEAEPVQPRWIHRSPKAPINRSACAVAHDSREHGRRYRRA